MLKPRRTPRRRSMADFLLLAPALAIMPLLTLGVLWLIQKLQSTRCPAETFLSGSGRAAMAVQAVPILLASIGFAFLAVNWFVHLAPPLRDFFDRDAQRHGAPGYRQSQRSIARFSLVVLSVMLPISAAASLSQYCLAPQDILYQPWPWTGLRHYSWQDVRKVETICTRGRRGGWNGSFSLILRDGSGFDIMGWPRSAVGAYPAIVSALEGVDFAFDAERVSPGCDAPYVDLLLRRP